MSREIKFRVWDTFLKSYDDNYVIRTNGILAPLAELMLTGRSYPIETKLILEQYTGLKDSKGVDIYEGDIVENGNDRGPVCFDQGHFFIDPIKTLRPSEPRYMGCPYWGTVIGNIHEHPYLLA